MTMFSKATKTQAKLRLALYGVSGGGKTYSALAIAKGLGGRVALIDTERGSASKYADKFEFDALNMQPPYSPANYVQAIHAAEAEGYDVLIIDSLTHAWAGSGGALEMVDQAAKRSSSNNSYAAWRDVTPQHNKLVDALVQSKCHVIATMRSKAEYVLETNDKGKLAPRKKGMAPIQREGMDFEFDVVAEMSADNDMIVQKSRCEALTGGVYSKPGTDVSAILKAWLSDGALPPPPDPPQPTINPDDAPVFRRILGEEQARIDAWAKAENGDLVRDRAAIIESYKAVKGVAVSIDLQDVVAANPATKSMSAKQILDAAQAITQACDKALSVEQPELAL